MVDDLFASYGLPTVKSNALPKYNLVPIAGKDILPSIIAKLYETNIPSLIKNGYIDLDEALYASNDKDIKQWLPHIEKEYPNKKPFGSRKLFIGNIKVNFLYSGKTEKSWFYGTKKGIGMQGWIFPFKNSACFPDDLVAQLGDMQNGPDFKPEDIEATIDKYFKDNDYYETRISAFVNSIGDTNPLRDKIDAIIKSLITPDDERISQTKCLVGFIAPKLNFKLETVKIDNKDVEQMNYTLNLDDIILIKPKTQSK